MAVSAQLTTVLLPGGAPMRRYEASDGTLGLVSDHSYLAFLIEALIAQSAVSIAVHPLSNFYSDLDDLPVSLRSRIRKVDTRSEAYEKSYAVCSPIIDEMGIVVHGMGTAFQAPKGVDHELLPAFVLLLMGLQKFLIGVEHRCQVPIDATRMIAALRLLRDNLKGSDGRANLASIEGIFAAYEPLTTPGLHMRSGVDIDRVRAFSAFVTDETYRQMSRASGMLGVPARATLAVLQMRRCAAELLNRPNIADMYEAGAQAVGVATKGIPPKKPLVERLLRPDAEYLPPLLDLSDVTAGARADWATAAPPARIPMSIARAFGARGRVTIGQIKDE